MGAAGAVVMRSVEKVSPASQMTSEINPAAETIASVVVKCDPEPVVFSSLIG